MAAAAAGDRPVILAAVAGAHGIRGEVRLKLFTASADHLRRHRSFDAGGRPLTLQSVQEAKGGAIARFAEITDRTMAEALRGTTLSVPRASLPPLAEGEIYWHDLVGRDVATPDGAIVGRVTAVENYGASDLLEITVTDGRTVLVPYIAEAVAEVDGQLRIGREWLA